MQRRKKQLLGLFGCGLVAAVTLAASAGSRPVALASDSASVGVTVKVGDAGTVPTVHIDSLFDEEVVLRKNFDVAISYTNASAVKVYLAKTVATRDVMALADGEIELDTSHCEFDENGDGSCSVAYALEDVVADMESDVIYYFTTRAEATNGAGQSAAPDIVGFSYQSAYVEYNGKSDTNGNPLAEVTLTGVTKSFILQAKKAGDADLFEGGILVYWDEASGKFVTNYPGATVDMVRNQDGTYTVKVGMPFKAAGATTGEYEVILIAYDNVNPYDKDAKVVALNRAKGRVKYSTGGSHRPGGSTPGNPNDPNNPSNPSDPNNPDGSNPEVPGTGFNFLRDLNISQADYIVTGLVAFGMVTGFAIFLIVRRNSKR